LSKQEEEYCLYKSFLVCVATINNYKRARLPLGGHREVHTVEEIVRRCTDPTIFTCCIVANPRHSRRLSVGPVILVYVTSQRARCVRVCLPFYSVSVFWFVSVHSLYILSEHHVRLLGRRHAMTSIQIYFFGGGGRGKGRTMEELKAKTLSRQCYFIHVVSIAFDFSLF